MLTSWMSVSIPNCLIESAHRNQLVQVIISKNMPLVESYLRTSCGFLGICIGKFFPKLRSEYPNSYVDLFFHTYTTPVFTMSEADGIMLNMSLAVDFFINPYEKTKKVRLGGVGWGLASISDWMKYRKLWFWILKSPEFRILQYHLLFRIFWRVSLSTRFPTWNPTFPSPKFTDVFWTQLSVPEKTFPTLGTFQRREGFRILYKINWRSFRFLRTFSSILSMTVRQTIKTVLSVGVPIPSYDNVTLAGKCALLRKRNHKKKQFQILLKYSFSINTFVPILTSSSSENSWNCFWKKNTIFSFWSI